MLLSSKFAFLAYSLVTFSLDRVAGREVIMERDGRAVSLYPRRFGQEHPAVINKLSAACPGQVCGVLAGQAITPLLAAQPECSQQDMADAIIDASKQFDAATAAVMVAAAIEYRQAEKNTPPDFTTNPPTLRNSVFCQKAPKNAELNGLVQAQDPANDPNVFFDPATKASVKKGSQANTSPFGGAVAANPATNTAQAATPSKAVLVAVAGSTASACVTEVTVTVTGTAAATTAAVTVAAGDAATTAAAPAATAVSGADFGSCTVPQIEFGVGFDNRKETSFQPVDKTSFNHGSAQNIGIITQFICDTLTNSCKANQAAKDICAQATTAAAAATAKTGAQADAFNAVFGITTDFKAVAVIDNQGRVVSAGTVSGSTAAATTAVAAAATTAASSTSASTGSSGIGNFGKCTVPQIEFGVGFDNRKETSFQPVDKTSFNHGSAQNIGIITQFICDTLTNTCGADATAKATCAKGQAAANTVTKGNGGQADAFNAAFGIITKFAQVQQIDNQGLPVGASSAAAAAVTTAQAAAAAATTAAAAATTAPAVNNASTNISASSNLQKFTGALGGVTAPTVTATGNGQFTVTTFTFNNQKSAVVRSCDIQNNKCADAANASGNKNGFTVSACNAQQSQCIAAA